LAGSGGAVRIERCALATDAGNATTTASTHAHRQIIENLLAG
jgi:hypothetical protein